MPTIKRTSQFKKDAKRIKKRGKDLNKLKRLIELLLSGRELEPRYHDHILQGEYATIRECHIEPDWLLLYKLTDAELMLIRTGTHSDLFK